MAWKSHPTIGCCGIDCGLCPRFYTQGASCCPGCGGEGLRMRILPALPHLPRQKRNLEACALCDAYPCARFDREDGTRDSFVTHRRVLPNGRIIREGGLETFLAGQSRRICFLRQALARHDDGRRKSLFCLAAALLSPDGLDAALARADAGADLKEELTQLAVAEGQELKLRK